MRIAAVLLCSAALAPLALANNDNNSLAPVQSRPTAYGLKIVRGIESRMIESEPELPIAGLSLGLYLNAVKNAGADQGPYAADLTEPLQDMGRALQAEEKHQQAMDAFNRALHLSRINEGLYSAKQLPLLDSMIESHLAMGQLFDADDKHAYRYRIEQRVYEAGDPELLQGMLDYTEWQRQAYLDGFSDNTYRRVVSMYDTHDREIKRLQENDPNDPRLLTHLYQRMQAEYLLSTYEGEKEAEAQLNISQGTSLNSKFALSTDLAADRFKYLKDYNYRNGLKTMQQIVDIYQQQDVPAPLELAHAKIAQGDWYLWWGARSRAFQCYEAAWRILAEDGSPLTNPDALFAEPVELPEIPVFRPGPITPTAAQQALATVIFNVTRGGEPSDIEVVEQDPAEDMGARVSLFRMLREMRFRPLVREGKVVAADAVVRVYRYDY